HLKPKLVDQASQKPAFNSPSSMDKPINKTAFGPGQNRRFSQSKAHIWNYLTQIPLTKPIKNPHLDPKSDDTTSSVQ
ncbi:hypothetical protein, partial [Salmonella sp. S146_54837]|uniref:hypothetical protein n=1 Tax=Salmonella sp. S146_54837 TaxID=2665635 RepID=UPI001CAA0B50